MHATNSQFYTHWYLFIFSGMILSILCSEEISYHRLFPY